MPRKTRKQQLVEAQNKLAPFLFDEDSLPVREDLVQIVKDGRYKSTGARLLDNEVMALRMVELLTLRWGIKRIARDLGVSPHSVRAAREALVARGELAPYKERVIKLFEEIVETGAGAYLTALEEGAVPAGQIPVGVGIFSDKRALALGEPTQIGVVGATNLDQAALSVEKLNAWVESLPALPADSQSTVSKDKPQ